MHISKFLITVLFTTVTIIFASSYPNTQNFVDALSQRYNTKPWFKIAAQIITNYISTPVNDLNLKAIERYATAKDVTVREIFDINFTNLVNDEAENLVRVIRNAFIKGKSVLTTRISDSKNLTKVDLVCLLAFADATNWTEPQVKDCIQIVKNLTAEQGSDSHFIYAAFRSVYPRLNAERDAKLLGLSTLR